MKIWQSHSSENRKCICCNKGTGQYKVFDKGGITIRIPACDEHYDSIDVKAEADVAVNMIKTKIKAVITT